MLVTTAGCTATRGGGGPAPGPVAVLSIIPADGAGRVAPDAGISVKATGGQVTKVTVADAKGRAVRGAMGGDGLWRPRWPLRPSAAYTVSAAATGTDGRQVTATSTFGTLKPDRVLASGMSPLDGEQVGVGMPVQLLLSRPITSTQVRAAIERSLVVRMSQPVVGAWSWVSDREVQFRPRAYWPVGERVTVVAHLAGLRAGPGLWGTKDRSLSFTVGPEHITE
ncbi:Ig-like domain-containing protein, partial [Nonomuraea sp. NPDC004297]